MPLNATNFYVKGLLDGLDSPQYGPVKAVVSAAIPTPDLFVQVDKGGIMRPVPFAYVWAQTIHEDRQTMPRGPGWKKMTYRMDVILQVIEDAEDPFRESAFPCLFDAVRFMFNTTTMPVFITDPTTGYESQMLQVGEEEDYEVFIPVQLGPGGQGNVKSTARITLKLEETMQSL